MTGRPAAPDKKSANSEAAQRPRLPADDDEIERGVVLWHVEVLNGQAGPGAVDKMVLGEREGRARTNVPVNVTARARRWLWGSRVVEEVGCPDGGYAELCRIGIEVARPYVVSRHGRWFGLRC